MKMQNYKADDTIGKGEGVLVKREIANRDKELHTHEFIEIIFISDGEGIQIVDGTEHRVKRGDILFVNFGESHAFKSSSMEFTHILLRPEFMSERLIDSENIFDVFALPRFSSIRGELSESKVASFSGEELHALSEIIDTMLSEYEGKRPGYRAMLYGYMQVLFTMLIRCLSGSAERGTATTDTIARYIDEHLSEHITLGDIARNCFYNPSYFSRKFKSVYGKNLIEYINERRLMLAKKLLCETDDSVTEIGICAGFVSQSHFYKSFKKRYGYTPLEYRKKVKSEHL
ncbi:MAG: AraC family transcriptional regulator [Acutalibacteraceae bacterium]|nr:AraC family transcriptional regulator [Acutalibacteraceae bacterium]